MQNAIIELNQNADIELEHIPGKCDQRCSVCASGHAAQIRQLQKSGKTLGEISAVMKDQHNLEISVASISRHLSRYKTTLTSQSLNDALVLFEQEKENLSKHQAVTLMFINAASENIWEQYRLGNLRFSVEQFTKMLELFYRVLRDPDKAGDDDILAIFQKIEKDGVSTKQGVLFRRNEVPLFSDGEVVAREACDVEMERDERSEHRGGESEASTDTSSPQL